MRCLVYVAKRVKSTRTTLLTLRGWKKRGEKRVNSAVQRHLITLRERLSGIAPSIHLFPSFALSHSSTKRFSCPVCNPHPLYLPVIPPSSHPSHSLRTVKDKSDDKRLSLKKGQFKKESLSLATGRRPFLNYKTSFEPVSWAPGVK